ncbi:MAG: hypothetical protein MI745_09215 [Pseudomonadales bacterium]|nr:hypothetical protein [Pseudomonadales bacterium]
MERVCSQGPLASAEVAEGCCGQIVRVLVRHGYRIAGDQQWQLPAWRERKARLHERRSHSVDCTFREDQVWPWPGK